jgi:uncharacterized protein (TIGR02301 family)
MKKLTVFIIAVHMLPICGVYAAETAAVTDIPAVETSHEPAPYDGKLTRLSEILGSLDFIRNLCGTQPETQWKAMMAEFLESDANDEQTRKARLIAAFNRGYRSFSDMQTVCSADLRAVADRYRIEGATLASEIVSRYGN